MALLFLFIAIIVFLVLNSILENIWWIGTLFIIVIALTFIKQVKYIREFGFDGGELMIILLKLGSIAFIILLMTL